MAQLYGMVNCFKYTRASICMSQRSSNRRIQYDVELNVGDKTKEMSSLGLYAMNGGEGPNSYAQNSSYQVSTSYTYTF